MATPAQAEFNDLMRDKSHRSNHPEDDNDDARSFLNLSDDDGDRTPPASIQDADEYVPRASVSSGRPTIPRTRYGANTGPKGVISDAQNYRDSQRVHRTSLRSTSTLPQHIGQKLSRREQILEEKRGDEDDEDDDFGLEDGDGEFMSKWREGRLKELQGGGFESKMHSRPRQRRLYGAMVTVDGDGYLEAVEGSGGDTVVVVYIYDDISQVSQAIEDCLQTLAQKHQDVRFVKLHYQDAEMEPAGVPALIAYRAGEKFAGLVPIVGEIPEDAELSALTLESVLQSFLRYSDFLSSSEIFCTGYIQRFIKITADPFRYVISNGLHQSQRQSRETKIPRLPVLRCLRHVCTRLADRIGPPIPRTDSATFWSALRERDTAREIEETRRKVRQLAVHTTAMPRRAPALASQELEMSPSGISECGDASGSEGQVCDETEVTETARTSIDTAEHHASTSRSLLAGASEAPDDSAKDYDDGGSAFAGRVEYAPSIVADSKTASDDQHAQGVVSDLDHQMQSDAMVAMQWSAAHDARLHNERKSPLMSLPAELRNKIFKEVVSQQPIELAIGCEPQVQSPRNHLAVAYTCRTAMDHELQAKHQVHVCLRLCQDSLIEEANTCINRAHALGDVERNIHRGLLMAGKEHIERNGLEIDIGRLPSLGNKYDCEGRYLELSEGVMASYKCLYVIRMAIYNISPAAPITLCIDMSGQFRLADLNACSMGSLLPLIARLDPRDDLRSYLEDLRDRFWHAYTQGSIDNPRWSLLEGRTKMLHWQASQLLMGILLAPPFAPP
ncbi:hypothetical protein LTR95_012199 [Oleoguttula sp. CCFEE 5521]